MSICGYCNWTRHEASAHKNHCKNGHPLDIVGVRLEGRYGRCKECQRDHQRKYDKANRLKNQARWQRWYRARKRAELDAPSGATP